MFEINNEINNNNNNNKDKYKLETIFLMDWPEHILNFCWLEK